MYISKTYWGTRRILVSQFKEKLVIITMNISWFKRSFVFWHTVCPVSLTWCDFCCIYHDFHLCHCCCSVAKLCPTLCDPMDCSSQASLSFTISQSLLKRMSIESVMPSSYFILCYPLLFLPLIFHSIMVFLNESAFCISWPEYWSFCFSFSISPSNEYSVLIYFRNAWFDILAVQRALKSLLQHHSSKASTLQYPAFFIVQLSHLYMTTS